MSLAESREWVGPVADGPPPRPAPRLHATGAVLFATLEVPQRLMVAAAGKWAPSQPHLAGPSGPRSALGSGASRCVSWLLGR